MSLIFRCQPPGLVVLSGILLLAGPALPRLGAQALDGLKKGYEEEILKTVLPLREGYRKALLALEQSLALKGDYAGAHRVQLERQGVEKQMGREPAASAAMGASTHGDGRVILTSGASGTGGVREEAGAWIGWEAAGSAVRWALPPGLQGGGYALAMIYRSTGAGVLPIAVREDFHVLIRKVEVEAAPDASKELKLGVLRVRPGATALEIKLTGPGTARGFQLLEVHLIPEGGGL